MNSFVKKLFLFFLILSTFLVIFSLQIKPVLAEDDSWLYADYAELRVNLSTSVQTFNTEDTYLFESATLNLSFIPQNTDRQNAKIFFNPMPNSYDENEDAIYEVRTLGSFKYGYVADITTTQNFPRVTEKIGFPTKIPVEFYKYLAPSKRITSDDPKIIEAASKLVEGEDDYFVAVDKISNYVNKKVNYSLDTLFVQGSKDASWVFQNEKGVCSEISVLFIAMLRSVGIPARFVSGVSYTNSPLFNYKFGPHAWAEVYYPGVGWVPYDITYGEFGYIDLGHIETKKSVDASETSTTFYWKAKSVDLTPEEIKIDGEILKKSSKTKEDIKISLKPYYPKVGFLSYNVVVAEIENKNNYYVSKRIKLGMTENLKSLGDQVQIVLFPHEKKIISFVVQTSNLDKNYVYTFPVTVYTEQNESGNTEFQVADSWLTINEDTLLNVVDQISPKKQKKISKDMDFSCFVRNYYIDEDINLKCTAKNLGNSYFDNAKICLSDSCKSISLGINQELKLNFTLLYKKIGSANIPVLIEAQNFSKLDKIPITIFDDPKIIIENISIDDSIGFSESKNISFLFTRNSSSKPKNVVGKIIINGISREVNADEFVEKFLVKSTIIGSELSKENSIVFQVTYEDDLGRKYSEEQTKTLKLNKLTFKEELIAFWNKLNDKFDSLIS